MEDNTSTPKRRRLGVGRICSSRKKKISSARSNYTSVTPKNSHTTGTILDNCDSPQLPSNQVKYLCDSGNTSYSDISCSFDVLEGSFLKDTKNSSSGCKYGNINSVHDTIAREIDNISEDMFKSKLERSMFMSVTELVAKENLKEDLGDHNNCEERSKLSDITQEVTHKNNITEENSGEPNHEEIKKVPPDIPSFLESSAVGDLNKSEESNELDNKENKKEYERSVEETFDFINETICNFDESDMAIDPVELQNLFASPGPYRKTQNTCKTVEEEKSCDNFYGLPMMTKALFKTYRNVEKFYDWQEECLNLEAIKKGKNLIYALPTSGGKTLVAEVLMLRQVLNNRKNVLFILPYVAIVQEKIWALSPFALQLGFLVEEYAGGKGNMPPTKRRKKHSIYVATIEKGLALIRSLIELKRLDELGLIVVDELHLIGERSRGGTLETLLATVLFTKEPIQIVGMSATIGNLDEIAKFLKAEVYERQFRPVQLTEYVKLGGMLHRIQWRESGMELVPDRELVYDYAPAAISLDPDLLGGLVSEVVPEGSCLVFCPTKRNCENVAALLCKMLRKGMTNHRLEERLSLQATLRAEGSNYELMRAVKCGVAYHHAGLTSDERGLLENAFRSGVISVLCCTSTLAAGVNLPAQRVLIRAPYVGSEFLTLAAYRQMVGRAGRAGICEKGESIMICPLRDKAKLSGVLRGGLLPANSALMECTGMAGSVASSGGALAGAVLGAVSLGLCTSGGSLRRLLAGTLLAVPQDHRKVDITAVCDNTLKTLIQTGALKVTGEVPPDPQDLDMETESELVYYNSELAVSDHGKAAVKGGMDLSVARQLAEDLEWAARGLVLLGALHLLYVVTPHDAAGIRVDYRHYYSLYCELDEEGLQTAKTLGITENNAIRMMTGKPITSVPVSVLCRFYVALMLRDLWRQMPLPAVAEKYLVGRGVVQAVVSGAASFAVGAARYCECEERRWPFAALLAALGARLRTCAAPELHHLMDLPAVKKGRALQLMRAGYKRIEDIAKASPNDLMTSISHLSKTAATQLISAARLMLIEKVENLRAEAEEVMEELKM
ncbi:helicase POLQ-like isoform X2 [Manduca sexta]|uniref:Helicase POLQ-like n=1 Tax=Manduca sexta TaxID=7130 RepID=A0A921YZY5_MANSE|nr:helicase POLQ-like isoform X2 [Manduca sexta]KAG6447834.1 hypothetical protein O3G_MSEX005162 [Manduca sexta]